ncbi:MULTISPECIES: DUF2087 domain-containing protein [Arsenicicoccus]|uniref:DUF2087 domain-containing protein n=1 Tax=Arsenicicoccus TaxID=267408 RepID=UPI0025798259|nr:MULTISPECIES: DUF2087 domain-containing protein [Arsenicicoccus]
MTQDADLKTVIRARMERTGETYTAAQAAVLALPPPEVTRAVDEIARLVRPFVDGERIVSIPVKRRRRVAVLLHLLSRFEIGRSYAESEVTAILGAAHEDHAWLRRELVNYRYLHRDSGIYRVTTTVPERDATEAQEIPVDEAAFLRSLRTHRG